jgi:hypothetical protein
VGGGADARARSSSSAVDDVLRGGRAPSASRQADRVGDAANRATNRTEDGARQTVRRVPTEDGDARVRTDRSDLDGRARAQSDANDARISGRADATADGRARANLDGRARADATDRDRINADDRARAGAQARTGENRNRTADTRAAARNERLSADWARRAQTNPDRVRNSISTALNQTSNQTLNQAGDFRNRTNVQQWNRWGNNVRSSFRWGGGGFSPYYSNQFWSGRNLIGLGLGNGYNIGLGGGGFGGFGGGFGNGGWWGYQPWLSSYPYSYWWGQPRWNMFSSWFPNYGWSQPYYYNYGPGGNIVYRTNGVYVGGQYVGTPADYAASAADLAYVDPSQIEPTEPDDWKPLGTFSVAINEDEENPPRVIQLAINQDGLISGTIFNRSSDKLYTVQGRVDKDTQRVAFTIGNDPNVVLETGLYNLTLDETPVLVHFNEDKTATYLFVRLEEPEAVQAQAPLSAGEEALR